MTRETDSSSSGPQGRGGAAYPSGTPPYGSRPFPSLHPQERTRQPGEPDDGTAQDAEAAATPPAEEAPRTETTLTTRIRINIPGSRPIPPVVVRTTVDESAAAAAAAAAQAPAQADPAPEAEAPPEPEPEKTSDWFAPRKTSPAAPPSSPAPAAPFGRDDTSGGSNSSPYGSDALAGGTGSSPYGSDALAGGTGSSPYGSDALAGGTGSSPYGRDDSTGGMSLPFGDGSVPGGAPASPYGQGDAAAPFGRDDSQGGAPGTAESSGNVPLPVRNPGGGRGAAPSGGSGTPGSLFGVAPDESTGSTPYLPPPVGSAPGEGEAARGSHDTPAGGFAAPFANEAPPFGAGSPFDTAAMPAVDGDRSPYDTGSQSFDTAAMPAVDDGRSPYDTGSQPFGTADFPAGVPRPSEESFPGDEDPLGMQPYGPTAGPATGTMNIPPVTPEAVRPPTGPNGFRPPVPGSGQGPVSGDTVVSGIPAVQPGESRAPRQAPPRAASPGPAPSSAKPPARTAPAPAAEAAPPAAARPAKKKGRSKPVLLGVAVGVVLVVAYGAGLLMNHADVPKGTTVLGVDIGNQNRDAAVKMLDTALGNRATAPLQLTIGGQKRSLKPSVAGLSIDTDATVRDVAHADYNPVSVIGSLFGGSRTADPVFVVDEDKLKVALQSLAGAGTGGSDAMVRFEDGKAIGVPGTPRKTLDVAAATAQVEAAYRTRAETGADSPVALNATTSPPRVSQAELDKAVNGFGKTAMSGKVTVRADAAHTISFNRTLPQFLTMVATPQGTLTPHIDLDKLKSLYGQKFDNVLVKRADGSKTQVTPQDVATALLKALSATSPSDRTVTLSDVA
ncbi:hypothetical protein [Actinacidiphila paucisporea]|uniref:Peptidoglycan binding domain-containing protein n=1 Tax=Actinacidiphila paucisporea TaxID=310782 RepID=A0A1M6URU5_9ACTN|nr:hypothetical protein [Actinacidiphila paucisporea]SHK71831.1 hypothetical protein SAMN05216499_101458 [Actinacidiphila paucisporea]